MSTKARATIEDLYNVPENGKAEIVNGELVRMPPTGGKPGLAGGKIFIALDRHATKTGHGYAFPDNVGFIVHLPNRDSFSPDAAYYIGAEISGKFPEGAPIFAVEVRSESDYGPRAEQKIAAKISDYFAAGTLVVWDVDVLKEEVIRVYRANDPANPTVYRRGEIAEAEPALPGWSMNVDDAFSWTVTK